MSNIREPARKSIRGKRLGSAGPLYVPPEVKDPGYEYRWEKVSNQNPFAVTEAKLRGWEFVPAEHLNRLGEGVMGDGDIGISYRTGNYITCPAGDGGQLYLMRIKSEIYQENLREDAEERKNVKKQREKELESQPGVYKKHELYD